MYHKLIIILLSAVTLSAAQDIKYSREVNSSNFKQFSEDVLTNNQNYLYLIAGKISSDKQLEKQWESLGQWLDSSYNNQLAAGQAKIKLAHTYSIESNLQILAHYQVVSAPQVFYYRNGQFYSIGRWLAISKDSLQDFVLEGQKNWLKQPEPQNDGYRLHREAAYQVYYKLQHFYKNNPLRDLLQKYTKDIIGKDQALFENLFCYLISAVTAIIALIFHVLVVRDVTAPKNTI